jgi:HK97 family phage prohead protease
VNNTKIEAALVPDEASRKAYADHLALGRKIWARDHPGMPIPSSRTLRAKSHGVELKHADYRFNFKALGETDGRGTFSALVSVFGNVDAQGDRVMPGAFAKSLVEWRASGKKIPIIWSHDWSNPFAIIGGADPNNVKETRDGLQVDRGSIDLTNDFGRQVYSLLKQGLVGEWSFGYKVLDEKVNMQDGVNELLQLDLIEAGPTLKGANSATELLAIKGMNPATEMLSTKGDVDARQRAVRLEINEARRRLARLQEHQDNMNRLIAEAGVTSKAASPPHKYVRAHSFYIGGAAPCACSTCTATGGSESLKRKRRIEIEIELARVAVSSKSASREATRRRIDQMSRDFGS